MEAIKYLYEFFFCDIWHYLGLLLLVGVIFGREIINIKQKKIMEPYIKKSDIVAEIERIDKSIGCDRFLSEYEKGCNQGKEDVCNTLRNFLDTLEVKDLDIMSEVSNWWNNHYKGVKKDYTFEGYSGHYMENSTIISLARHFFELGLKAQSKDIIEALRTEYEKGRADALANALTLDEIKGMENQAFLAGIEAERNKSILKNNDSNRKIL